jgi:tetratricopeptide (TPR) repeat protein
MTYSTYDEVRDEIRALYNQKKYAEALEIVESVRDQFPEQRYNLTWNLAVLYKECGEHRKALDTFERGVEEGMIYPLWRGVEFWKPLESYDQYDGIMTKIEQMRDDATAKTAPAVEVQLPTAYTPETAYPLFITLHGGNESIDDVRDKWRSNILDEKYIHTFIQSSQVFSQKGFSWTDSEIGRKDIRSIYEKVINEYSVDTERVIIGGFSQGGGMALDITLSGTIPIRGFVLLCPHGEYSIISTPTAVKAAQWRVRGTIITGTHDNGIHKQREMEEMLTEAGVPLRFIEVEMEHWYPADFSGQVDAAVTDIVQ